MTDDNKTNFKNFAVLTGTVSDVESKESSSGTRYKVANLTATGITYTGEDGHSYHPVIEVLAFKGARKYLQPGGKVLTGRLSYSEYEDDDGEMVQQVKLIAATIRPRKEGDRERAFANLTLRAGKDAETRISSTTGLPWTQLRAALSMGKDDGEVYRPSLWLTLKAFSGRDGSNEDFVYRVGECQKGDYVDAKGGLTAEAYQGRLYWSLFLNTDGIETHDFGDDKSGDEEEFEAEREWAAIPD